MVKSLPASNAMSITNPPKKATTAYPISTFTYAIVPHNAPQKGFLQQFLNYDVTKGQTYGAALDFAPLPKVVLTPPKRRSARSKSPSVERRRNSQPARGLRASRRFLCPPPRRKPGRRGGAGPCSACS